MDLPTFPMGICLFMKLSDTPIREIKTKESSTSCQDRMLFVVFKRCVSCLSLKIILRNVPRSGEEALFIHSWYWHFQGRS